jgi:cell division protein FtsI (penicillin-binding protein 3)
LADSRHRLRAATVAMAIVLSLFIGRLFQLQGLDAAAYAAAASSDRQHEVKLLAERGTISDRHGAALATTVDARNVTADQTLVAKSELGPRGVAEALAPMVGLDVEQVTTALTGDRLFAYVAKDIDPQLWNQINDRGLPGIFSQQTHRRTYPGGDLAANVIGFVGGEGTGLAGLESSLNRQLMGVNGKATYEVFPEGGRVAGGESTLIEPQPGRDITLTLDRDIQWQAQSAIAGQVQAYGAESGTVVVMEATTGKIRALATAPSFDPNDPLAAAAQNRGNRPVAEAFEPGSTGKVITAAALIEAGVITPGTPLEVPNRLERAGKSFKDFQDHETQHLTFAGTLAKSSNIGIILAAERLGYEQLHPVFGDFGIGEPTGLGLPGENTGQLRAPGDWSGTTGATMTFGQGYSANAVQMASVFSTIANGGVRLPPSLVEATTAPDGTRLPVPVPEGTRVVSERTARTVTEMLEGVVTEGGTAPAAAIAGYRVAGKTGTAQRYDPDCGCYQGYTMSFMGFAPADDPALVVAVILQDPQGASGGGAAAGPVFADVMSFALQSERIPPTGAPSPMLPLTTDR